MITYILKTLQNEDHVFIERLGSFRLNLCHAKIEGETIQPPHYEVVFEHTDSEENHFTLTNLISREQHCLFTQANEQVNAWVSELLTALQNNKSVTYEDFGTFMLDKKGNISFESAVIPQLNSLFEGMEPIDLKQINAVPVVAEPEPESQIFREPECANNDTSVEVEPVEESESQIVRGPEYANNDTSVEKESDSEPQPIEESVEVNEDSHIQVESVEESESQIVRGPECADDTQIQDESEPESVEEIVEEKDNMHIKVKPVDQTDEEDEDDDEDDEYEDDDETEEKKHHLAWLWILLLLIAVLAAVGFVFKDKLWNYYQQWKEKKQPVEQVVEPQETPDATTTIDEVTEPVEPVEETIEPEQEPEPEVFTPTVIKQSADGKYDYIRFEKGHYYAIAGSFPNESDVIRHIRQKNLDQYSPKILKQDGFPNLRVCIGVFDTESEAESFAKGINSGYWVLK